MIFTERTITVVNDSATINKPLILYRGDKNIELKITIAESQFKFRNTDASNVIETTDASYAQLVINTPYNSPIFSDVAVTKNGAVIFVITEAMIDEIREVGAYEIQIRLLDDNKQSRASIPPVSNAIEIREPIAIEDGSAVDSNAVNVAKVNRALTTTSAPLEAFDSQGNYIKKTWGDGDPITDAALNKMEAGIDGVNKKVANNSSQIKEIANKINSGNIGNSVEPTLMDMPRIYFSEGTLPTTKTATMMKFDYYSKTKEYHGWVEIKCQGNSSMAYPKKNFTIKSYEDKAKTNKLKIDFKGWGKQSKFVLKANWIDISHSRNVVSARLWGDIIKTRSDYATAIPELLRTSPNQGAIDGFPVLVYSNGVYQGRYTLNIPKDKWMSNMDDTLDTHCILCGENYTSGCFRALPVINGTDWTDELHDVVPTTIKTSWTNAINFVMTSTDDDFKTNLSNYFDVNSLIDYYLYGLVSTNLDGFGKNQLFFCYDGVHWIASVYDLDSTWGLYWNGSRMLPTDYRRNQYEDYVNSTGNLLYNRLEQLFMLQLKTRYTELRKDVLSASHIIQKFEEFNEVCPKDIVQEDYASTTANGAYTAIPSKTTNNIQQLRSYIDARLIYVDSYINSLVEPIPCTAITLDKSTLSFTTADAQTLTATVTPENCTQPVVWSVSPEGIVTVVNGLVTAVANGEATVTATCGSQSANCAVTVSGIEEGGGEVSENILQTIEKRDGYYNDAGVFTQWGNLKTTDYINMPSTSGRIKHADENATLGVTRVSYFDENKTYLGYNRGSGYGVASPGTGSIELDMNKGAKYFVVSSEDFSVLTYEYEGNGISGGDTPGGGTPANHSS